LLPRGDGSFFANVADLTGGEPDGSFVIAGPVNWSEDDTAPAGRFTVQSGFPDQPVPGIPGTSGSDENIAAELVAYVEFPTAGIYRLGVNSADGFRISAADAAGWDGALRVEAPAQIAGLYYFIEAGVESGAPWAPPLHTLGAVTGEVVYANPPEACQPLLNADAMRGKLALIDRNACRFDLKAKHARDAGAVGVLVVNSDPGTPVEMGGVAANVPDLRIPVVMIREQDGARIKEQLAAGNIVRAALGYGTPTLGTFDGGRSAQDTVSLVHVPEPGLYPLRCLWYQGEAGGSLEWFTLDAAGHRTLLNDLTAPGALKAYRARRGGDSGTPSVGVAFAGGNVVISFTGRLEVASQLPGPFEDAGAPTSPLVIPAPAAAHRFWRARGTP
jgi:hypothetical protein